MTMGRTLDLIEDLRNMPAETSWVEFKENLPVPTKIAKTVAALSNAARMADQHFAYLIWGIRDEDHQVVGTTFEPTSEVSSGYPWEFWLAKQLKPSINFRFQEVIHPQGRLVLLEIPAATSSPVEFEKVAYIRIGSATPPLSDFPERLQALWAKLQPYAWESGIAAQYITADEVLERIDYSSYFDLTNQPLPDNRTGIFEKLSAERLVVPDVGGKWNITNLGAILFAKNLRLFEPRLERKAIRCVAYAGNSRSDQVIRRQDGGKGYANGFAGLIDWIKALLPNNEHIGTAFRIEQPIYPDIVIRELIANALIHQDMTITGAGPQIEFFNNRMEITNPGLPLISPERFIDSPPRSRNEAMASLMRRMRLCEEQGSGIDKVIRAVELFQLPPPDFLAESEVQGGATKVILFAPRAFTSMTESERIRACYQHAALCFLSGERMQNNTLRKRFGVDDAFMSQVSRVISQAVKHRLIKPADPTRPKSAYVPYWA